MTETLEAALRYAARGWLVFPVHSVQDTRCSCGEVSCGAPGKHPRITNGVHAASNDPDQVQRWWTKWPDAGIGLACGPVSGVLVLDIDPRHSGDLSLAELEASRPDGPLPQTLTSLTGGGGQHLFYRWPKDTKDLKNKVNWLPGIDLRGHGAYVVLPPSSHLSGTTYQWDASTYAAGASDATWTLSELPEDVVQMLEEGKGSTWLAANAPPLPPTAEILRGVPEGQRDDVIFRACRRWANSTNGDYAAVLEMALFAARNCDPPFPEPDVHKKVEQALKYFHEEKAKRPDYSQPEKMALEAAADEEDDGGPLGNRNQSDKGNALRLRDRYQDDLRYVPGLGWHVWADGRWRRDREDLHVEYAKRTVHAIYDEARQFTGEEKKQLAVARWALKSEAVQRLTAMVALAKSDPHLVRKADDLDQLPWLLNCPNGTVDLRTGELMPHDPAMLITKLAGARYVHDARAPHWRGFLAEILPDEDVRAYVQRAVGYSLTGLVREKCLFICQGSGDNGKSVFMEVLKQVFSEYAINTPASTITIQRHGGGIPNDVARLQGARFVMASETNDGDRLNAELVKRLTGGDTVSARFLRQEFFDFTPQLKLWLATNHAPSISDFGEALWSRIRLIPFHVKVPKDRQIPRDELEARLLEEAEGILWWAVEGAIMWSGLGLAEPDQVRLATEAYRVEQDWFAEFLQDQCVTGEGQRCESQAAYERFKLWCEAAGLKPWTKNAFGRQLAQRGFERMKLATGQRGWSGLGLKDLGVGRYGI